GAAPPPPPRPVYEGADAGPYDWQDDDR
ncbi:MAG: hypothetical protein QOF60_1251, partial [Actinomycetota bacterium]|nr:hypothetical protein [Actinomycetota bacterium]